MRKIEINEIYHHFKGNDYKVLHIAKNTETLETVVVYEDLYDKTKIWVRPYEMFNSLVDTKKYPNLKQKYRFELKNKEEN